jgi:hypothetical protein
LGSSPWFCSSSTAWTSGGCGGAAAIAAATHGGSTGTGAASIGSSIGSATRSIETLTLRASAGTAYAWISTSSIRGCARRNSVPTS